MKKKNLYRELSVDFALTVYGDDVDSISKIDVELLLGAKPEFTGARMATIPRQLRPGENRNTLLRASVMPPFSLNRFHNK